MLSHLNKGEGMKAVKPMDKVGREMENVANSCAGIAQGGGEARGLDLTLRVQAPNHKVSTPNHNYNS